MKSKIITGLKKEVLVIELPENGYWETYRDGTEIRDFLTDEKFVTYYTLLGKPDEIKEDDVKNLVEQSIFTSLYGHYVSGIDVNTYCYKTALESFNSALESEISWVNPLNNKLDKSKPLIIQTEHLNKWKEAQEKTFDRKRTLIFVKN